MPAGGPKKFGRRKDAELKAIYDRFLKRSLFEKFPVSAVAVFEAYLVDVLAFVFERYPQKMLVKRTRIETHG